MWSERERQLIQKYSEEIRQQYNQGSRVPLLATPQREPSPQAHGFLKFGRRFIIPREHFREGVLIIVRPFADGIELSEYQYLIDTLRQTSSQHTRSERSPDREMINNAIERVLGSTRPNYMIVPIAFFVDLHNWDTTLGSSIIQYQNGHAYYTYAEQRLRVLWSNKFISLNEIIIGSSRDGLWLFRSANGDERLTARFYFEEEEPNPILLVQTVFRFQPPAPEQISVIDFPERLCRIE